MPLALVLDILVAILLVITIGYAWTLNKRLGLLRQDKGELEKMALNFHTATDRAEDSIARLKINVETLQNCMEKAESLRDDLVFLSERGGGAADRLEVAVRAARDEAGVSPAPLNSKPQSAAPLASPIPDGIRPNTPTDLKPERTVLKADRLDRSVPEDSQSISDAERELLKALRSAE